jgi:PAS domain S-box-containing protein
MPFQILIVDDHQTVRNGLRSLLSASGDYLVCGEAVDGIEAIRKAKELRPDLVLMDVSMPRMDGLEAARAILLDNPRSKIIIVSQNDPLVVARQAKQAGAVGFVGKANLPRDLMPIIGRAMNGHVSVAMEKNASREAASLEWVKGSGEMSTIIRSLDWSKTPLGSPENWSPTLRMMVNFLLANRFPQLLWWGEEFCSIYNDAYIPVLGAKHPWAVGRPVSEVWGEIWHVLRPLVETPFRGGPSTWNEDIELLLNRRGFNEESHFTIAYSPVPDDTAPGGIGGVLATVHEITDKIQNDRRIAVLRQLGAQAGDAKTPAEACEKAAQVLAGHKRDVPFAMLYLVSGNAAYLAGSTGVDSNDPGYQKNIEDLNVPAAFWPIATMVASESIELVKGLDKKFTTLPLGAWTDPVSSVALVPLRSNLAHQLAGFMIVGISPNARFDEAYRNFFELMSTQIATTIANARAYEEERRRSEALAEIDRAKTAFFSNVSHEFRTPLTLMLGPLEELLARSHTDLPPAAKGQLELVNRNGVRLLRLVNTLLDFSRIEAGRVQAIYQATDIASFTADLASVFRSATEKAGLELKIECPPLAELAFVDRDMWEKIVLNLVSNAFKFTFDGEIKVQLQQKEGHAELQVSDTGVGIPSEEMPKLFERFHRIENTRSRTHEGSGIGLALVHELVKLHGGAMRVESVLGKGTTFFVSIPLGKDHLDPAQIGKERTLASTTTGASPYVEEALRWLPDVGSSEHDVLPPELELMPVPHDPGTVVPEGRSLVLVADDNADMRQYLSHLLKERYEVVAVADGEEALKAIHERRPDLVLSDVMMPRLDGFGLVQQLRSHMETSTLPVILLSARAGEESRVEGLDIGADDYLVKPFSARELLARVSARLAITQIREASDEALRASEERLRALVNASSSVVYRMSPDWKIMRQLDGKGFISDTQEPTGDWLQEYIQPQDQPLVLEKINEAIRHKSLFELEHPVRRPDGSLGWTHSRAIPILGNDGEILEWFGAASDITRRKQVERTLHEHRERFDLVAQASQIGFWFCDLPFDRLHWDERVKEHFWLPPDADVAIDTFYERLHPDDREPARKAIEQSIANNTPYDIEYRTMSPDGRQKWIRAIGRPYYDPSGRACRFDGLTLDITERTLAEERERAITAERTAVTAKFRAVFEQTTQFAGIMTLDGTLIDANRLSLESCGFRSEEVLGKKFSETPWWRNFRESREKIREAIPRAAKGTPYREMLKYSFADGTDRLVDFALYPIVDEGDKVIFLHPTGVDVTDVKHAEDEYRKLAQSLESEVKARTRELEDRTADVMRHSEQLRRLSQRLLQTQDEERRHIARELHDSAGQTLTVLGLSMAQLASDVQESAPHVAKQLDDVKDLVQQLHKEIRTTSYLLHPPLLDESGLTSALSWYTEGLEGRSGLDIKLHVPEDFGRVPREMELAIFRLVQECLANIHRHSGANTAHIRITRDNGCISVEVADNGNGMPPERLAEIRSGAHGVGLRGMRERVLQFRGDMQIDSNSNGTRIMVNIPLDSGRA